MVIIRLAREGKKNDPFYRIVAIESKRKREGKALDILGTWFPRKKELEINRKKLESWVGNGAQISAVVSKLIAK